MTCPMCKKKLKMPTNAQIHVERYQKSALTVTDCCGGMITIHPRIEYSVREYLGDKEEDDWGRKTIK